MQRCSLWQLRPGSIRVSRAILARKLIKRRVAAGWTQEALAERAGVRVETISRLESGKHRPHQSTIVKLDEAFEQVGV